MQNLKLPFATEAIAPYSAKMGKAIDQAMNWRYAVQKFDPARKIDAPILDALLESVRLSASSYGLQPIRCVVISDAETQKKLKPFSYNQDQIDSASHLVVFTYKEKMDEEHIAEYVGRMAETHEVERASLSGFEKIMKDSLVFGPNHHNSGFWAAKQAYIAMGTLLTSAALMGVDSCPMEGIQSEKYDEILGIKGTGYKAVMLVALGYRSSEDSQQRSRKVRVSRDTFFRFI